MTMPDTPLVSVVIPAYDAQDFVAQAVNSVLSQSYQFLEVIVVDDGSRDGTKRVVEAINDERLQILSGPNQGVSSARNRGLSVANGALIAFLDADDYWFPHKLDLQVVRFAEDPDILAVGSLMRYESPNGRTLGVTGEVIGKTQRGLIATGRLMPFTLSSTLFRIQVIRELGGFDEGLPKSVQVEDLDLIARVASVGKVACIDDVLGAYRIHPHSASASRFSEQRMGTRYVRAKLAAEAAGNRLDWDSFVVDYRPTWRQRYGDWVQASYRVSGLRASQGHWMRAVGWGLVALILGPRYTMSRFHRQQGRVSKSSSIWSKV